MQTSVTTVRVAGREIVVEDDGPESGFPVLVHHSGSRHLFPGAVRDARASGLRLISYDRPGQGGSTPQPNRTVADSGADVRAIVTALGLPRMAVWGTSAGGPYALATAALMPEAVASVCLFASVGPCGEAGLDFAEGMGDGFGEQIAVFFADPDRAKADFLAGAAEWAPLGGDPSWWLGRWEDQDRQDPAYSQEWADYLALINRDGYAGTGEGWWEDWAASFLPWGFDPAAVQVPVALWHGLKDTSPPPAHSRWLADRIPHATAHFPADEDHTNVEEHNRAPAIAWVVAHQ